jgi:hypothetical protein
MLWGGIVGTDAVEQTKGPPHGTVRSPRRLGAHLEPELE